MATQKKLGDPRGVKEWQALDSIGDVKRLLRWTVLSLRNQSLDRQDATTFAQLAHALLRAIEGNDLEQRLEFLEKAHEQNERKPLGDT